MNKIFAYKIDDEIFKREPQYKRVVIIFKNCINRETPPTIWAMFKDICASINATIVAERITEIPVIKAWRHAFRNFGINSSSDRPAIEALLRRAVNNPTSFKSINFLVDLGNIVSLQYLLPVGVHPFTEDSHDYQLKLADGNEKYADFVTKQQETIAPGEIIFADGDVVQTRKWVWRQSAQSMISISTKDFFLNIDFINDIAEPELFLISDNIKTFFEHELKTSGELYVLTEKQPSFSCEI